MALAEKAKLVAELSLQDKLSAGLGQASKNLGKFESGLGRAGKGVGQVGKGIVRTGAIVAGVAATGLAFATKKAIDFDDAFANVAKNVEASAPEIAALKDGLHALATRVPVQFDDLAAIASEAGALGIATPDVLRFTETMARLSSATQGLTVEDAAEAFGKFRNSLHLNEDQIERSASALVTLGKTAGSSEGDIIEVAKRFAGAGHTAGLSAAQILGLSSAISSLGVAPEAAGGSLSRLFNNIGKFIGTGDKKLKAFAKTTGQTTKGFAKSFRKDALGTFEKFLKGLSKLKGPEQQALLKAAGVNNVRDISALQLLAASWGEVSKQTDAATDSFNKNTDLTDTSNKRFDTLSKKLDIVKNGLYEAAYNLAEGFLPALGRAADKLTKFLRLPENKKALQEIGSKLGESLDKIDFDKLLVAAKSAVGVLQPMVDVLLTLAGALNALPSEVKGAGVAAIVANKLSGGLLGAGIGNIIGGLGSTLAKSLAASIPVFGKAFVQPVFVTNMGAGLGGGVGSAAGGGVIGKAAGVAAIAIPIAAAVATWLEVNGQSSAQAGGLKSTLQNDIRLKTPQELQTALNGVNQGIKDITDNPLKVLVAGDALTKLNEMKSLLAAEISSRKGGRDVGLPGGKTALQDVFKPGVDATGKVKDATTQGLNSLAGLERTGTNTLTGALGNTATRIASAIANARVVPNVTTTVTVNVTPAGIQKATNTQVHYGKPNGSAGGGNAHGGGGNIPT